MLIFLQCDLCAVMSSSKIHAAIIYCIGRNSSLLLGGMIDSVTSLW